MPGEAHDGTAGLGAARRAPWAPASARPGGAPPEAMGRTRVPAVGRADALATGFAGSRWRLLWLALRTSALTVLTLGVYRFWMKTRVRRWYWSAVRPGGHPIEYTGDPVEKLLGFLIAVVVLAFYLGLVNLGLMFASLAVLSDPGLPTVLTTLGLVPMIFYARYRARRYLLARTRWRGIRFGLEPGAVGYAGRAMMHWAITVLTLGILWPRMTFALEKYRTDRTTFGDHRLHQGGCWQMLLPGAIPVWVGVILTGLGLMSQASLIAFSVGMTPSDALWDLLFWEGWDWEGWLAVLFVGIAAIVLGAVHYSVRSFRLMADRKTAGDVGLRAAPRLRRVIGIHLLGNAISVLIAGVMLIALGAAVEGIAAGRGVELLDDPFAALSAPAVVAASAVAYYLVFLAWGALRHAFVTMPLLRHYATTLAVTGAGALAAVRQAERDEATEAGGFAEALDVGAAI